MKKIFAGLVCLTIVFMFCGCAPQTEYDDKEILKIESVWVEGFAPFPRSFVRSFDFKTGDVTDTWVAEEQYISENYPDKYNTPIFVTAFDDEQAQAFIDKVKSLGFYTWEENYITTDIICDGGNETVTVYFADGTVKSTYIYFENPPKYDEIMQAFEAHLGATLYLGITRLQALF